MANKSTAPIKKAKTRDAFLNLVRAQHYKYFVIAKFQLNTGLRISDVLGITVDEIHMPNGKYREHFVLREIKTGKSKDIYLNQELRYVISHYIAEYSLSGKDYLFPGRDNSRHVTYRQVMHVFSSAAEDLSIERFGSHSLRKTWGYIAYNQTKNIGLLMEVFNHSSSKETLRYIGIDQAEKEALYKMIQI